jgi:outer membrane immunogenic protein
MSRRIGLFAVSALLIALPLGASQAADLAAKAAPLAPAPAPLPSWTGYYTGAHIGGAWGNLEVQDFNENPGTFSNRPSGVFGGLQFGYNFQWTQWLYGVEVDTGGMDLDKTTTEPNSSGEIQSVIKAGFYGDITSRLGYVWNSPFLWGNSSLLYVKGGIAYYNGNVHVVDVPEGATNETNHTGWTIGGGFEQMINPNWSWKLEYQYFTFGNRMVILPADGDAYNNKLTVNTVKLGINYHFH